MHYIIDIYTFLSEGIGLLHLLFHWYGDRVASVIGFSVLCSLFSFRSLFSVTFFLILLQYM